jgi:hypothetical protein
MGNINITDSVRNFVLNKAPAVDVFHAQLANAMSASVAQWRKIHPDISWTIDKTVQQDTRVAFRYTAKATHNGQPVSWNGAAVAIVEGGKIVAVRVQEDWWGRLIDLGQVPVTKQDSMSGHWHGELFGIAFTAEFEQDAAHKVTGSLNVLGDSAPVAGSNDGANVHLAGSGISFAGTWAGTDKVKGTLNGPGFNNVAVSFNRG